MDTVQDTPTPSAPEAQSQPMGVAEDVYETCACVVPSALEGKRPPHGCVMCAGTGYHLAKRVLRPVSLTEQALRAELKTLEARYERDMERAARTLLVDADLFTRYGHHKEAQAARMAAQAIREGQEG